MKLINFRGLNCYTNSIVSIADDLGCDYSTAFSALWSETVFNYQPNREVYLSKRLPESLESAGVKLVVQLCDTPGKVEERLAGLEDGEAIIIGMDAFHVPWSQFFSIFHGPHFFVARYTAGDAFFCYDPTFDKMGVEISRADVVSCAYDISRLLRAEKKPRMADPLYDVHRILDNSETRRYLLGRLERCADGREAALLLAKFADALQNNRYLYRHYLEGLALPGASIHELMGEEFFSKWTAVKNGLYKASVSQNADSVLREVHSLLSELLDEEMAIAGRILSHGVS